MTTIIESSTIGFDLRMDYDEGLVEGDFVQANGPNDDKYIAQITHTESSNEHIEAKASVIGNYPDLPFKQGTEVAKAEKDLVLDTLSLPSEGCQIGSLRDFGSPLYLSVDKLMEKQIGVFGRTGSGKSYTAAVLAEEMLEHEQPIVIIDPHGEYASLKVRTNGSPSDYRVIEYADKEFNTDADRDLSMDEIDPNTLARPGQASIINLRGVSSDRQEVLVNSLLDSLFLARKRDQIPETKVFLEEAHLFAPQRKNETREIIENVAKEGRKFGFTLALVSQRPSEIYANIRAQLQAFSIHKLTDDTDIKKIVGSAEGLDSSWETQIQKLNTGEVLVVGDVIASPTFVNIRDRYTKHHDGSEGLFQTEVHAADATEIEKRQKELDEEVTEDTVRRLLGRIATLEEEKSELREQVDQKEGQKFREVQRRIRRWGTLLDEINQDLNQRKNQILDQQSVIENLQSEFEVIAAEEDFPADNEDIEQINEEDMEESSAEESEAEALDALPDELIIDGTEYNKQVVAMHLHEFISIDSRSGGIVPKPKFEKLTATEKITIYLLAQTLRNDLATASM